ncbi:hypothetical protein OSB04_006995 [Centaurea solstitialis]|uniref:CCHC-type domain-containing protein n=1 Tax=Centaurea solstitialis TaxID=347529 RepID=A0AA38TVQ8_9ASTR|nr:hypothetical protein OSB04_006995 [Centaurea solstitialis]
MAKCKNFHEMHVAARTRELELERQGKRKKAEATQVQTQVQAHPTKKFKSAVPWVEVKKEFPRCSMYGKHHMGECRFGTGTCYKCRKPGHTSRECKTTTNLAAPVKVVEAGASKKPEVLKGRARVYQLMAEEAKEEPDVVIGTFSVNSLPTLVLFDSGASKSFVSLSFCKGFTNVKRRLHKPLEVEIAAEEYWLCRDVYKNNVIEIEGVKFNIDLIPISMREINVVAGLDWLSRNGGHIDSKARKHVLHGGHSFLAYVVDSRDEAKKKIVADVLVVSKYSDVFPDDLPGIPPERQVEFQIDLVPGAAPVAKSLYRLAPPEMQVLVKAPPAKATVTVRNAYRKHSDYLLDVGYLMLATMSPVFRTRLINTNAYNMIRQLRDMFQTQARTERYDASRALNACKMAKGTSVSDHENKEAH